MSFFTGGIIFSEEISSQYDDWYVLALFFQTLNFVKESLKQKAQMAMINLHTLIHFLLINTMNAVQG